MIADVVTTDDSFAGSQQQSSSTTTHVPSDPHEQPTHALTHAHRMEEPEARSRRRLDPKAASLAGFLSPHANHSHGHGHGHGNGRGGGGNGGGGGGGGWKARLKERCLNRVRQERDRLVQEMRGLASPPPIEGAAAAASDGGAASRPFLSSPPPVQQGQQQQQQRASTPSSWSGAALSILQDEIRETRWEQQRQQHQPGEEESMAVATQDGDEEEETLSVEEHWELMRCIEEMLAQEVAWAEQSAAGEYSQLEHAEVEGSVAQLYDYEEVPPGTCVRVSVICE